MTTLFATCDSANIDPNDGTCTAVSWVEDGMGWLPELSHEDGATLGVAIFGLLAVAYLLRIARRKSG